MTGQSVLRWWPGWAALALVTAACGGASPTRPTTVVAPVTPEKPSTDPTTPAYALRYTRFLAFGDSFTEGVIPIGVIELALASPDGYPAKLQAMLQQRYPSQAVSVVSSGLPGERVADGLARLPRAIEQNSPQVLLLFEGVNDLNGSGASGIAPIVATLGSMVALAQGSGVQVLVANLPPQRPGGSRAFVPDAIVAFNAALAQMAASRGAMVVDVHGALGADMAAYIGADGLHPTLAGYERMGRAFYDAIRQAYEVPGAAGLAR